MMHDHFAMFARYNRWANRRLFGAAGALSDADFHADRGAFFRSVCGTLNHLLVTDRIWLKRITGTGDAPGSLDAILHDDFAGLDGARAAEDERIVGFVDGLDEERIAGKITYRRLGSTVDIVQPLRSALAHWFNHQAHHRGQTHALVTALAGAEAGPVLDLLAFQRETGIGMS